MKNDFWDLVHIRQESVDGEPNWFWIKTDNGAWDGPKTDWETSHKPKIMQYCKQKRLVLTAGGNQGMYTRLYSKMFDWVYSFEPDPLNFHCMVNNNQSQNVFKFNCALGAMPDVVSLHRPAIENTGMHEIAMNPAQFIPMLTLDSFNLPYLDLLQLDVEGFEDNIIRGGIQTIEAHKPIVMCERGYDRLLKLLPAGYRMIDQSISDTIYAPT